MIAVRNSANDGEIAVGGLYLVFQQEVRLLIEKSVLGQYNFLNLTVEVFPGLKKLQIFRDAARYGILLHRLGERLPLHGIEVCKRQRLQANLRAAPAIKRTIVREGVLLHHADQRPAEDQHNITVLQDLVPGILQNGRKGRVCLDQIRKLVNDQHLLFLRSVVGDLPEQIQPVREGDPLQHGISSDPGYHAGKTLHALGLHFLCRKEVKCLLIFDKFFDQGRLSDAAPSVDHNKAAIPAEFLFQRIQFFFSSDKVHLCHLQHLQFTYDKSYYDNLVYIIRSFLKLSSGLLYAGRFFYSLQKVQILRGRYPP